MEKTAGQLALAALLALGACGSGGGSGASEDPSTQPSLTGNLTVLDQSPADGAVQVALDATLVVTLDGSIVAACLDDAGTYLETAAGVRIPGTARTEAGGHQVHFAPSAPLQAQTDYVFHLSPLTCDGTGRLLDRETRVGFRTRDDVPPRLLSASLTPGQLGVGRTDAVRVIFDETLDAAALRASGVRLRRVSGATAAIDASVSGNTLLIAPVTDLVGAMDYRIEVDAGAVADVAGNPLAIAWSLEFRTATDTTAPQVNTTWPTGTAVSPRATPEIAFDEAIEPATLGTSALRLVDSIGATVATTAVASRDQYRVRLIPHAPLSPSALYRVQLDAGASAITDRSGNPLATAQTYSFTTGTDSTAPRLRESTPQPDAVRVTRRVRPEVQLDEPIDPLRVTTATVVLAADEGAAPTYTVETVGSDRVRVLPSEPLAPGAGYTLTVRSGLDGLRDTAGNPLGADIVVRFRTAADDTLPDVFLLPFHGQLAVPTNATAVAVFDSPIDPATVHDGTVKVVDGIGGRVAGTLTVTHSQRAIRFVPRVAWAAGQTYIFTVVGGVNGVLEPSGNSLAADVSSRFRFGHSLDVVAPNARITINDASRERQQHMSVTGSGFEIRVDADDFDRILDMSTVEVVITGDGGVPGQETVFADAIVSPSTLRYTVPTAAALAPGDYELTATVRDLAGNIGTSAPLSFQVRAPDDGALPFERTQVMWVRFDLDRDRNGRIDHEDDLLRLGLMAPGDPAGTNARMVTLLRDGILAQAHALLGRDRSGAPLGADAVPMRLVAHEPRGLSHARIACGGLDPEADQTRRYGQSSSGVLGRAFFDYRNGNMRDVNTGTSPGLGVFPGELFLFEARVHSRVYPAFLTSFARRFLALVPDMGGTPAGAHPLDAIVLAEGFDETTATSAQRARYRAVFDAADDWATAVGIILAHEIGHAVGLVAEGDNPRGLHGDRSLHNALSSATDVMAPAVGYDALVSLGYSFRDINLAYLQQRLLMK
ncbi:MAG: Ig-like domain-containing protein [Planctomycetota bacterium]